MFEEIFLTTKAIAITLANVDSLSQVGQLSTDKGTPLIIAKERPLSTE